MRRVMVLVVLLAVGSLTLAVAAYQQPSAPKVVEVEKLKDNLFMLKGGGGNTAVFVRADGVVVVDTKNPGWGQPILDKIKGLTSKPITMIINTHTHGDHVSGNVEFPATVDIVTHENTKVNMEKMAPVTGLAQQQPPPPNIFKANNGKGLPKRTFKDKMSLGSGGDEIDLYYFGAGHTNGDAVIVFPALRTAVMGDLFARKWAPLVDAGNGGSAVAFPQTLAKAVAGLKDVDTVITGHATTTIGSGRDVTFVRSNPVMNMADLREYADFTRDFVAAAEAAMKAGKGVDEAVSGLKLPDRYKAYNTANLKADVQRVYAELKR